MKNPYIIFLIAMIVCLTSCSKSPIDKAQSSVKSYLKENLKNASTYEPISFSQIDTLDHADTSDAGRISLYKISHIYSIINSEKDRIKMTISFYLDKDFKVNKTNTKSINGNYGSLAGNVYWKYNNYVGNKPDAGSEIKLYSLDTIRGDLKFEAAADVQGNYRIEKIPPGKYFLIVRSQNTTDCPDSHLSKFRVNKSCLYQLFGLDLDNYSDQTKEMFELDSLASAALTVSGNASEALDRYYKYEGQSRDKSNELLKSFPEYFIRKIKLYTGYSNAYDFGIIYIEEGESASKITDFGITCI